MPSRLDNIDEFVVETVFNDRGVVQGFEILSKKQDEVIKKTTKVQKSLEKVEKAGFSLSRGLKALGLAFGFRELMKYSDEWTKIRNTLSQITENDKERVALQEKLANIAKRTRTSTSNVVDIYAHLGSTGLSEKQKLNATEIIEKALKITGGDEKTANTIMNTLKTGKLRSLLGVNESFANIIASGMNISLQELQYRMKKSGLSATQVLQALSNKTGDINKGFAKTKGTFDEAMTRLKDGIGKFFDSLEENTGIVSKTAEAVEFLANNMEYLGYVISAYLLVKYTKLGSFLDLFFLNMKDGIGIVESLTLAMKGSLPVLTAWTKAAWSAAAPWLKLLAVIELVHQAIKMVTGEWNLFAEFIDDIERGTWKVLDWITGQNKSENFKGTFSQGKRPEGRLMDSAIGNKPVETIKTIETIRPARTPISTGNTSSQNTNINQNVNFTINQASDPQAVAVEIDRVLSNRLMQAGVS